MLTRTGNRGEEILLWADLYLWVSNMRNANTAQKRLTHNFPRKRMTSPITFTLPIRKMLFMIKPVAIADALQKLLPVIAIWVRKTLKKLIISINSKTNHKHKTKWFMVARKNQSTKTPNK